MRLGIGLGLAQGLSATSVAPVSLVAPTISTPGNEVEHALYTATPGVWLNASSVSRQWYSNGTAITGANALTYQAQVTDVVYSGGVPVSKLEYRETATGPTGATTTISSNQSGALKNGIIMAASFHTTPEPAGGSSSPADRWLYYGASAGPVGDVWDVGAAPARRVPSGGPSGDPGYSGGWATPSFALPAFNDGGANNFLKVIKGQANLSGSGSARFSILAPTGVTLHYKAWSGPNGSVQHELRNGDTTLGDTGAGGVLATTTTAGTATGSSTVDSTADLLTATNTTVKAQVYDSDPGVDFGPVTVSSGRLVFGRTTSASSANFTPRAIIVGYPEYFQVTSSAGNIYVDAVSGSDTTGDGSISKPFQHMPGTKGAGGVVPGFTMLAGSTLNLRGGQHHRAASFALADTTSNDANGVAQSMVNMFANGTSGSPVTITSYGGGTAIIDGSEVLAGWAAAASGDVFANPNLANIQKLSISNVRAYSQALIDGEAMLYPAQWPYGSLPSDILHTYPGSQWYQTWLQATYDANIGGPGATSMAGGDNYVIGDPNYGYRVYTLTSSEIVAQYGSVSLIGAMGVFLVTGSRLVEARITSHNTATGQIGFRIPNRLSWDDALGHHTGTGQELARPDDGNVNPFRWAIRYHPYDVRQVGQFAWDSTDVAGGAVTKTAFGHFATSTRGIKRWEYAIDARQDNVVFDGVNFSRFGVVDGYIVNDVVSGYGTRAGCKIKNATWTQSFCDTDRFSLNIHGIGSDFDFVNVTADDNLGGGGFIASSYATSIDGYVNRRMGGSAAFIGATAGPGNAGFVKQNFDSSDNLDVHGNGLTIYTVATYVTAKNFYCMNHPLPLAIQQDGTGARNNNITNFVATGRRPFPTFAATTSNILNLSTNELGSLFQYGIMCGTTSTIGLISDPQATSLKCNFKNCVIGDLSNTSAGALTNYVFTNCYFLRETNRLPSSMASIVSTLGATDGGGNVVEGGSGVTWTGVITDAMRKALTADVGGAGVYQQVILGPQAATPASPTSGTANNPWVIPAWGQSFTLTSFPARLTTVAVPARYRANLCFASVVNTAPESSLSLPAAGDNALFGLSNGQVYFLADATAGTYSLVIRQTNSSTTLSGGGTQTLDTTITITVS